MAILKLWPQCIDNCMLTIGQESGYSHLYSRAAFQYGVKMSEGRKTRRFGGGMSDKAKEKAKLNREWQKISAVSSLSCYAWARCLHSGVINVSSE